MDQPADLMLCVAQTRGGGAEGQEPTAEAMVHRFGFVRKTPMSQNITFTICKGNTKDL